MKARRAAAKEAESEVAAVVAEVAASNVSSGSHASPVSPESPQSRRVHVRDKGKKSKIFNFEETANPTLATQQGVVLDETRK